ncbi:MAG: beta-ketoacyl-ACP synthase II [Lactobacillaceae bacterium]|jgi:3-oxoacyl-[acyl-carrier-protein] synthase II|nr:beta-ketoacyl-ACP synthase II [Lactobacillaceae bacterium]
MRRVVVTGMGIVSPLGRGIENNWNKIVNGKSGIKKLEGIELKDIPVSIGGQIRYGQGDGEFDPDTVIEPKEQKRVDKFILFGIAAGKDAVEDSGWKPEAEEDKDRSGVMMGSGIGGLQTIYENSILFHETGSRKISPFFIPASLINLISGHLSIEYGYKGPNHACVTACSTGTHAIGDAAAIISRGDADVMLAGGAEAAITSLGLVGFSRLRALTTDFNETPEKASRPWDKDRSGFVMGEGAGAVVLEELEHAKARGAKIYAEVVGYGMSGDAYHITAPSSDGDGAYRAMKMAVGHAKNDHGVELTDIGYINAHGTSTPVGDPQEIAAVKRLFSENAGKVSISSTKSAIGHLLGAAGAVEAIYSIKALNEDTCPPTLNLENPDEEFAGLDLVPLKAKKKELKAVMSNSFGFGGTNSSVIFKKYKG